MPKAKKPPVKHEPKFKHGIQAGWSDESRRWVSISGKFTTKDKALAENAFANKTDDWGGQVKFHFPTPISTNFEILELNMSGVDQPMQGVAGVIKAMVDSSISYQNKMQAGYEKALEQWGSPEYQSRLQARNAEIEKRNELVAVQGIDPEPLINDRPMPNYMPMQIQTRMNLARHYYNTDGDVTNIVDIPVELLARSIDVVCTDEKMRKDIEEFIAGKNLEARVAELWSEQREFGQAYPLEVWDGNDLEDIIPLNPLSVHVGYNWAFGLTPEQYNENKWSEGLIQSVFPPAMYRPLLRHWNDSPFAGPGQGLMLPGSNLRPIWDRQRSWERYSMPMVSKGFPDLVDRTVYKDSVRALVEGYKYQLWVVKVGDPEHPPLPGEIPAVKAMLNGIAGDRTGMLVWRDSPFVVEVHVPKGLQEMMSNDYWGALTKEFYRKMGITSQVVSGETPGTLGSSGGRGASAGKGDVDVIIYLERCRYQAKQVMDWLTYLVKKWIRAQGTKYRIKALDTLKLSFTPTQTEMAERIKEVFGPMYDGGALSHRTYVAAAGLKSDTELEYKKQERDARENGDLDPPLGFKQKSETAGGVVKEVSQTKPEGSPTEREERQNRLEKVDRRLNQKETQKETE